VCGSRLRAGDHRGGFLRGLPLRLTAHSGEKYERHRLAKDEAPSERRGATTLSQPLRQFPTGGAEIADRPAAAYYADDNRTNLSHAAVDFIHAGKVDEANSRPAISSCVPHVQDDYDPLGMIYKARGDHRQAADYYRKVTDVIGVPWTTTTPPSASSSDRLDPSAATLTASLPCSRPVRLIPRQSQTVLKMPGFRPQFAYAGYVYFPRHAGNLELKLRLASSGNCEFQ
jgi:hypothetical protein